MISRNDLAIVLLIIIISVVTFTFPASAESWVTGQVRDQATDVPLENANVTATNTTGSTTILYYDLTDMYGNFRIHIPSTGFSRTYTLEASRDEYNEQVGLSFYVNNVDLQTYGPFDILLVGRTVTRSFSASTVVPGETVIITINPTGLPSGAFYTYETIPVGFTFVSTTAYGFTHISNVYTFKQGDQKPFTYTLKAPTATGTYTFSGTYRDLYLGIGTVGGDNQIIVALTPTPIPTSTPIPTPTPTPIPPDPAVTRSFSASTVAPDSTVIVTIIPAGLPSGAFYIYETIPVGFTFVSSTALKYSNVENVYTFKQSGATAFTYTLKAPAVTGTYIFSGTYKDIDLNRGAVGGTDTVVITFIPSVSISTDKSNYSPGDRMTVGLNVTNTGPTAIVKASVWVDIPGGGKHIVMDKHSLSLPAGLKYSTGVPITLPNIPSGNYAWHAVFKNSKKEIISESIAPWTFTGTGVGVESYGTVLNNLEIDIE